MRSFLRALWLTLWVMGALWIAAPAQAQSLVAGAPPVQVHDAAPIVPAEWQRVDGTWLSVYGPDGELGVLMHVARVGSDAVPRLAEALGVPIGGTIHVVVAPSQQSFYALQPGRVPEWADGTAWPDRGQIYLRRPSIRGGTDRPLEQVLEHELVHILLGRAFAPETPPRWLQEGVATVLSGEYGPEMSGRLVRAAAAGHELSLDAIADGFPADPARAGVAYAESADFVAYLIEEHGEGAIPELVALSAAGAPLPAAVRGVTGEFLEDVEPDWARRYRRTSVSWTSLLSTGEAWWGAAGLGAVVGLVLARRRSRRRLAEMVEEEARLDALIASLWRQDERVH
jgi:hypothetical protein